MIRPAMRLPALMSLCAVLVWAGAALAADQTATLTWTPNTEPDLAGYTIYQSTISGQYGALGTTVGTVTAHTLTLPQLAIDQRYYFTLTARDITGNESIKSAEVSKLIPGLSKPGTPLLSMAVVDETTLRVSWPPVDDGTGAPALIDVRLSLAPISWGSAPSQSCPASPCLLTGLLPGTRYQALAVFFRPGTPNVFGPISAVVAGTTLSPPPPIDPPPGQPQGLVISKADPNEILIVARAADCQRVITSTKGSTATQFKRTVRCMP